MTTKPVKIGSVAGIGVGTYLIMKGIDVVTQDLPAGVFMISAGVIVLLAREALKGGN